VSVRDRISDEADQVSDVCVIGDSNRTLKSPWYQGDWGFLLRDPKPCRFISVKGQLGPLTRAFYCYRALESLNHVTAKETRVPPRSAWEATRSRCKISYAGTMEIKENADGERHGNADDGSTLDPDVLLTRTWNAINNYIGEYLQRNPRRTTSAVGSKRSRGSTVDRGQPKFPA